MWLTQFHLSSERRMAMHIIRFTLPDEYGIKMYINHDEYSLFPPEGRLTDSFTDQLLHAASSNQCKFELFEDPERKNKIILDFSNKSLKICMSDKAISYSNILFEDFSNAFLAHVRKYAIYFAAPYNYKAIMLKQFDEMVSSMKKYQLEADKIIDKINIK